MSLPILKPQEIPFDDRGRSGWLGQASSQVIAEIQESPRVGLVHRPSPAVVEISGMTAIPNRRPTTVRRSGRSVQRLPASRTWVVAPHGGLQRWSDSGIPWPTRPSRSRAQDVDCGPGGGITGPVAARRLVFASHHSQDGRRSSSILPVRGKTPRTEPQVGSGHAAVRNGATRAPRWDAKVPDNVGGQSRRTVDEAEVSRFFSTNVAGCQQLQLPFCRRDSNDALSNDSDVPTGGMTNEH